MQSSSDLRSEGERLAEAQRALWVAVRRSQVDRNRTHLEGQNGSRNPRGRSATRTVDSVHPSGQNTGTLNPEAMRLPSNERLCRTTDESTPTVHEVSS